MLAWHTAKVPAFLTMIRCLTKQKRLFLKLTENCIDFNYTYVASIYTSSQRMASIQASPQLTLMDEKVKLTVDGLEPGSKVTLGSQLDEMKMRFEAHAHFQADDKGEISMTESNSLGGSFTGVEPMGMFWSMQPSPGQRPGLRYSKKDVTTPMDVKMSVYAGHVNTEVFHKMQPLAETVVQKTYMGPNVERQKVHHGRIRGMLYKPKGPGPFPAIVDMFGTAGGILEFRSALLASRGFVSYSLPFFAFEDLPTTLDNIQLEYFEEAIDWLLSQNFVLPGGVGTVGVSTGGELSLLMATYFPDKVKAAVSINGSTAHMTPGVCYKGEEFPMQDFEMSRMTIYEDKSLSGLNTFDDPQTWDEDIFIKVEKAKGQLLYIVGGDDLNWPSSGMVEASIRRLKAHGRDNFQVLTYPKTGHLIEPPFAPVCLKSYHKAWGNVMRWGGSFKEHADAQEDSWPRVLEFFYKHVGGVSYNHPVSASKL